jgi:3'-phosphoadenosine 5'-phosphosulfate sulfotransferase
MADQNAKLVQAFVDKKRECKQLKVSRLGGLQQHPQQQQQQRHDNNSSYVASLLLSASGLAVATANAWARL